MRQHVNVHSYYLDTHAIQLHVIKTVLQCRNFQKSYQQNYLEFVVCFLSLGFEISVCLVADHTKSPINHYLGAYNNLRPVCQDVTAFIYYEKWMNRFVSLCMYRPMEYHIRLTGRNMVVPILRNGREIQFCIPHSKTVCCFVSYHHKISARPLRLVYDASAQKSCVWVNGRHLSSFGSASSSSIALLSHKDSNIYH